MEYVKDLLQRPPVYSQQFSCVTLSDIDEFIDFYTVSMFCPVSENLRVEMRKAVAKEMLKWLVAKKFTRWKNLTRYRRATLTKFVSTLIENKVNDAFCSLVLRLGLTCAECPFIVYGVMRAEPRLLQTAAPLLEVCWVKRRQLLPAAERNNEGQIRMMEYREFIRKEQPRRVRMLKNVWLEYKRNPSLWENIVKQKMLGVENEQKGNNNRS